MITALITRPLEDTQQTAMLLTAKGVSPLIDPLLSIHHRMEAAAELEHDLRYPVQVVVLTSANGAKTLGKLTEKRDLPLLAVGSATAEEAQLQGFHDVTVSGGNAQLLLDVITRNYSPNQGGILYVSGDVMALDIYSLLKMQGFQVKRIIGYYAEESAQLLPSTITALKQKELDVALFYSARTAEVFVRLIKKAQLGKYLSHMRAFALSPVIAVSLEALKWQGVYSAERPTQQALFDLFDQQANAG